MSSGLPDPPLIIASSVPAPEIFSSVSFATDYFSDFVLQNLHPMVSDNEFEARIFSAKAGPAGDLIRLPDRNHLRAVAEQPSRSNSGRLAVVQRYFAVDHHVLVACGLLHATPFAARKIAHGFDRAHREILVVVNYDISGSSDSKRAAVVEP